MRDTHLGSVTGVGRTSLGEDGLQLAQALLCDTSADTVILGDGDLVFVTSLGVDDLGLDGNDLGLELAGLLSSSGFLERGGGESILSVTGNVVLGSDVFT